MENHTIGLLELSLTTYQKQVKKDNISSLLPKESLAQVDYVH